MNELKQLSVALAEHADRLERATGVPYETCVRLSNIAERMEELAHDAQVEIDGLRGQVEQLREFALRVNRKCANHIMAGNRINHEDIGAAAFDVYKATSGQCLAEIKSQAVEEFGKKHYGECRWGEEIWLKSKIDDHLKQLRQQAKD